MQCQWYRLTEEKDTLLSQHVISDSESDTSVPDSRRCEALSGTSLGRQRGVVLTRTGSTKSSMMDSEMQSNRRNLRKRRAVAKTSHTSNCAHSLDALWRKFIELQIIALEQAQANTTDMPHQQRIRHHHNEPNLNIKTECTIPLEDSQSAGLTVQRDDVTPAVCKGGRLNPVAFDISPGISKASHSVPSLQPVTLQEALLHHKPMFSSHVRERQKLVGDKRMRNVQRKQFVVRETSKPVACLSIAERHYQPQQRHIDAKQAIQHTKRLYQQLPEVKAKQLAAKQHAQQQTNRLRAALYGQQVRQKLLKSAR